MRSGITVSLFTAFLLVSGCSSGDSNLNPFNWFGDDDDDTSVVVADEDQPTTVILPARPLIPEVTGLSLEDTPGGVIVRAVGLPPTQGWFDADLFSSTEGEPEDGVLTFLFVARPPLTVEAVSTVQSREIVVGRFVTDRTLSGIREIRVVGEQNSRTARP